MRGICAVDDDFVYEEFCSCIFVLKSNKRRYERLKEKQHNAFLVGDNKCTEKMVESKTLLEDWQVPSSAQPEPIENKEEEGGVKFVEKGKTAAVKKAPKGICHGCGMVNDHFL